MAYSLRGHTQSDTTERLTLSLSFQWCAAVAYQAPLSMEFSRQEYLSGLPFSTPGDLPDPGIEPTSLSLLQWQVDSLP